MPVPSHEYHETVVIHSSELLLLPFDLELSVLNFPGVQYFCDFTIQCVQILIVPNL